MLNKIKAVMLACILMLCDSASCRLFSRDDRNAFITSIRVLNPQVRDNVSDTDLFNAIGAHFAGIIVGIGGIAAPDSTEGAGMQWVREITAIRLIVGKINRFKPANVPLAKETLKVLLVNSDQQNAQYRFSDVERAMLNTIRQTFYAHINKHFSGSMTNIPVGNFEQEGRHSYIVGLGKEIVIRNIIDNNNFHFVNNGTVLIERTAGALGLTNLGAIQVYSLRGRAGDHFRASTHRPALFAADENGKYNIYFQLRLFVTAFANFDNDADGRFGSFYVTHF
jgi:hypothetical protein